ncbi:MAG: trigger factor [Gammaproteobacteria bacterium]|nr:trigger factor [Gammaproteobacteria bacterium]MDH5799182.1 trigger factor [Gammaproteobacteria bacterium]
MQVSVETTSGLERRMTVEIPKADIDQEVQKRLKSLAGKARLSGFRPGKVPFSVIQKRYGGQVQQEVIGDVMQSSFYEALTQEKLIPAGRPQIEPTEQSEESDLQYIATFEVLPEISVSVDSIAVEEPQVEISDEDIDKMIEVIRKQQNEWEPVEREAQDGDQVTIDFTGKIDGEVFPGGSGEGMSVVIGSGRMIKGFEEGLAGCKTDEQKTLSLQFPEQYHAADLAGKPVEFDITVKKVEQAVLPEINDEFAAKMGVTEGGLVVFREQVKANMQRELDQNKRSKLKQQVMDGLYEHNKFDVPKVMVENEIQALMQQAGQQAPGMELKSENFEEQARRRVAIGLILSEVVKQHNIKVSPTKVREMVENLAAGYEMPDEVVKYYYSNKERLQEVENFALEDEIVNWVMSQAKVSPKSSSFDEFMNPGR